MFTAYFDCSRSQHNRVTTVAGFVSRVTKWERLDQRWAEILKVNPSVPMFHMTDFVSSQKGWQSWKGQTDKRRILMEALVDCIKRNTNKGFAATLPKRNFDTKNRTHRLEESLGQEYAVCAFACIGKLNKWALKHDIDPKKILCIFEDGDEKQGDMIKKLRSCGFNAIPQSKEEIRRFDACDFIAWKARSVIDDLMYRVDATDQSVRELVRTSLDRLDPIIQDNGWVTAQALNGICADLKIPRR